jgi:hypothetical protein
MYSCTNEVTGACRYPFAESYLASAPQLRKHLAKARLWRSSQPRPRSGQPDLHGCRLSVIITTLNRLEQAGTGQGSPVRVALQPAQLWRWLGFLSMSGRVRYAGYGRRKILVTDGHEAEAKAAQLCKRPNRVGVFFLRVLGFRGEVEVAPTIHQGGHTGPSHMHPLHHEHSAPGE